MFNFLILWHVKYCDIRGILSHLRNIVAFVEYCGICGILWHLWNILTLNEFQFECLFILKSVLQNIIGLYSTVFYFKLKKTYVAELNCYKCFN